MSLFTARLPIHASLHTRRSTRILKRARQQQEHMSRCAQCLAPTSSYSSSSSSSTSGPSVTRSRLVAADTYQDDLLHDKELKKLYGVEEGVREEEGGRWRYRLTNGFGRVFEETGFASQLEAHRAYESTKRRQLSPDLQRHLEEQLEIRPSPGATGLDTNYMPNPKGSLEDAARVWSSSNEEDEVVIRRLVALTHITLSALRKERLYSKIAQFVRRPNTTVNACFGLQRQLLTSTLGLDAPLLFPDLAQHLDNLKYGVGAVEEDIHAGLQEHPYHDLEQHEIFQRYLFAPKPWKHPPSPTPHDWNPVFYYRLKERPDEELSFDPVRHKLQDVERQSLDSFRANWAQVCTEDATSSFLEESALAEEIQETADIVGFLRSENVLLDIHPMREDILRVHADGQHSRDYLHERHETSQALAFRKSSEKLVFRSEKLNGCYRPASQWDQELSPAQLEQRRLFLENALGEARANGQSLEAFFTALDSSPRATPLHRQLLWEVIAGFNRQAERNLLTFHILVVTARRIAILLHSSPCALDAFAALMPGTSFDNLVTLAIDHLRVQSTTAALLPQVLHPSPDPSLDPLPCTPIEPLTGRLTSPDKGSSTVYLGWSKVDGTRSKFIEAARESFYPPALIGCKGSLSTESLAMSSLKVAFGAAGNAALLDELHLSVIPQDNNQAVEACKQLIEECTRKELSMTARVLSKYWGTPTLSYTLRKHHVTDTTVSGIADEDLDQNHVVDELFQIFGRRRGASIIPRIMENLLLITPEKFAALGMQLFTDSNTPTEAAQRYRRASKWNFQFTQDPLSNELSVPDAAQTVFLKSIPVAVDEERLRDIMAAYGDVATVRIHTEHVHDNTDTRNANERLLHALKEAEVRHKSRWAVVDVAENQWFKSHEQAMEDQKSLKRRMERVESHAKLMVRRGRRLRFWIEQNWYQLSEKQTSLLNTETLAERSNEELRDLLSALVEETEAWCSRTSVFVTESEAIRLHAMKRWESFQKLFESVGTEAPQWDEAFARASELEDWTQLFAHLLEVTPEKMENALAKFKTTAHLHASAIRLCSMSLERIHTQVAMLAKVIDEIDRRKQRAMEEGEADEASWVELEPISPTPEAIVKLPDLEEKSDDDSAAPGRQKRRRSNPNMEKSQRKLLKAFKGWFEAVQMNAPGSSLDKLLDIGDSKSMKSIVPKLQPTEGPYAFVTFTSPSATDALLSPAVKAYGMVLSYPDIKLDASKSKKDWNTPRKDWNHHKVNVSPVSDCKTLWVADLPLYLDQEEAKALLEDKLASAGLSGSISVNSGKAVQAFNGVIRVSFESYAQALLAFQILSEMEVYATKLRVSWKSGLRSAGRS